MGLDNVQEQRAETQAGVSSNGQASGTHPDSQWDVLEHTCWLSCVTCTQFISPDKPTLDGWRGSMQLMHTAGNHKEPTKHTNITG